MKKLFLLDAYALIFRAYYAFIRAPMVNSKGMNTSAVFGFVNALEDILNKEKPSHIGIVFDPPGGSFRRELFPEYKANREETPEDIKKSVPYIKEVANAYRIPVIEIPGYEADDVIGTLAKKAEKEGFEIYMMTPDKDFSQLVSDKIRIYKPSRGKNEVQILGPEEVNRQFGIDDPLKVIDILALWGDASDNIPGAPGIGEKTAKKLISEYGGLKELFNKLDSLKGKQQESLRDYREQIELSYRLATIVTDVPVPFEEARLVLETPDKEKLIRLFQEMEFHQIASRVMNRIEEKQVPAPQAGTLFSMEETLSGGYAGISDTPHHYVAAEGAAQLSQLAEKLLNAGAFSFDTETTSLDVLAAELVGISFCIREKEAFYVPVPPDKKEALSMLEYLKKPLETPGILKIGQNCKFDIHVLKNYGIEVSGPLFDTMIAHYLIQPEGRHNLNVLAENYLHYRPVSIETLIGERGKSQGNMRNVPREMILEYAAEDADIAFRLKNVFEPELKQQELNPLFQEVEMPLVSVLADMERAGIHLRREVLEQYSEELRKELETIENDIFRAAGVAFNISSPKQLGEILFEKLKLEDKPPRTKTGQYATNEEYLQKISHKHPVVARILEHRSVKKLLSTYVDTLPGMICPQTGRLHTSFNQTITATGRLSSTQPNLQNIPVREERGREIRKAFIPADNEHLLLSADYSQVELRLMAHMSGDENMIAAFGMGEDIHRSTAANIYKISPKEVTREMRAQAKTANFGIIYGISAFGLSQRLQIDRNSAKKLIDGYFEAYPGVKEYMDNCIRLARENGYVQTIMGRKRFLPDIHSRNATLRGMAERNAINAPIQGSAADLIKLAMIQIHREFKKEHFRSAMVLQVHDELVFDVYLPEMDRLSVLVKKEMEEVMSLKVPLVVDIGKGNNWLEAH